MRKTKWFCKLVTAIVAMALVCQMSFSSPVAYAAWEDDQEWDTSEDDVEENDDWEEVEDTEGEDEWDDTEEEDDVDEEEDFEEPELSSTSLSLKVGSVAGLNVTGDYEYVEWSSSKSSVAKVDSSGAVKAVKAGTAVITAKVTCIIEDEEDEFFDEESEEDDFFDEDDSTDDFDEEDDADTEGEEVTYTLTCKVKVVAPTVKISAKKLTIKKGKTAKLKITGTNAKVTWKSSKKKVATVKNGVVTAKKTGKTKITAKVAGKTLICNVTVKK